MDRQTEIDRQSCEERYNILTDIVQREEHEGIASAELISQILSKLNIAIEKLPLRAQKILQDCATHRDIYFDPMSIYLLETKEIAEKFQDEYQILKLRQMNAKLQTKIDQNNKFIEALKKELISSRQSLSQQNPNPENINESISQVKQKLMAYELSFEKRKTNFSNLNVSDAILPKSLTSLVTSLAVLREEEVNLKRDADDVQFIKQAVTNMKMIR